MKYKNYDIYKDSGIEWIGNIPIDWNISKFKNLCFYQEGPGLRNWQFKDDGVKVICVTNITDKGIDFTKYKRFISMEDYTKSYRHFRVNKGDILLSSSGASWGKVAIFNGNEDTILNTSTIRFEADKNIRKYIKYLLESSIVREQLSLLMTGSCQPNFGPSHISKLIIPIPSIYEQEKIGLFLDKKTSEINELIEKKEKLIELLKEKREAIITEAVTKGLDKNVKMKDSGIEWIGEIPACWDMINLGYKTKMIVPMRDKPKNFEGDIPWIRIEDFEGKYICDTKSDQYVSKEIADEMNLKIYPINTVLCSCSCRMGITAIVKREMCSNQTFIGIVPNSDMDSEFLYYLMKSNSKRLQYLSSGALQEYLSRQSFEHLKIQVPSLKEQKYIAKYIDSKVNLIDELIEDLNREIEIINDYKKSLISEVVTGKIDVRNEL